MWNESGLKRLKVDAETVVKEAPSGMLGYDGSNLQWCQCCNERSQMFDGRTAHGDGW